MAFTIGGLRITEIYRGRATDRITVSGVTNETDKQLAEYAGFNASHFGYNIVRFPDDSNGIVHVNLWKD